MGEISEDVEQARKLLSRLDLPGQAAAVLAHERYWTPAFCRTFFEACDRLLFENPRTGLPMAQVAPLLAQMLPDSRQKSDLLVHGLAVLGGALRASGSLLEADGTYRTAFAIAQRVAIAPAEEADLHRRYSNLLLDQGKLQVALASAQRAVKILKTAAPYGHDDYCLGAALIQRGVVRIHLTEIDEAIEDFGLALVALDPKANERAYYSAIHNLAFALGQTASPNHLHRAYRHLRTARQMPHGRKECQARYKLFWVEASLLQRMGSPQRAEECLEIAREGFARVGCMVEMVLTSIELAVLYKSQHKLGALLRVTEQTLTLCRSMNADSEALALLDAWQQAVSTDSLTCGTLRTLAETFDRRRRQATVTEAKVRPMPIIPRRKASGSAWIAARE